MAWQVAAATRGIRCLGSCALNLCGVAMGRLDAFYEIGFGGPWDVAAAAIILEEAGGQVRGSSPLPSYCPSLYLVLQQPESPDELARCEQQLTSLNRLHET